MEQDTTLVDGATDIWRDVVLTWAEATLAALPRLGFAVTLILVAALLIWALRVFTGRIARRAGLRRNLTDVILLLISVLGWSIVALMAITIIFPTVTPSNALTTLGLGSVAIGFAFKDTFENFLAGILILVREPFEIGDHIHCENVEGQVEQITIRDTHIRQTDGQLVVVPNAHLFHNPVQVRTNRDFRRTSIICGVAYGEDVDQARRVIADAVRHVDSVRDDVRDIQVFAKAFGASSIDFEITWWTGSQPVDIRSSRDQVVAAVKRALDDAGIEIPFPYRTLTVNDPIEVKSVDTEGAAA
ncbi:mechanosensitive ion channel family protein [Thalassococcus sp. S3]|uniref:mechanosensitive ion channel family protein n=1 Tax=Thalassococcus sp. S3 TaxID=2017482 RepID=UPI0010246229|nr:mechanosensitive ion channel family protein [Thalassococcus sp. S3]QBF33382.1 mechanosensitive ion channel protein MscS [Thalassococcus sp. S3]